VFQLVAKLNNFRRLYPTLSLGSHVAQYANSRGRSFRLFAAAGHAGSFRCVQHRSSTQNLPGSNLTYAPAPRWRICSTRTKYFSPPGVADAADFRAGHCGEIFIAGKRKCSHSIQSSRQKLSSPHHTTIPTWSAPSFSIQQPMEQTASRRRSASARRQRRVQWCAGK